ncbi:hypothetical protein CO038_04085 [Candidatus Pacearchaeota archaeon CG_4_9_14_0_2_um_filter_39_13]|nr:50S ribosomal protein L3 [Candidatus Pacearchaeota archaeon]OIO44074.1 MAG: hypothetical protein AUJ64_00440 [Candidatus Pacearchaeota archaeon CG1_02_39_14]PJC44364.1 MAG: hypothetical protein CO038_04085 [Candidatus Pacearchaeota archaeon CG_4_9_14_0_2_um_filter_39_13]
MSKSTRPRHGSLQFWPRKRASRFIPSVNWKPIFKSPSVKEEGVLGCIGYKVGMTSVVIKDNTPHSLTKGKRIVIPATILEVPNMQIFSVRFYKNGKVIKDIVLSNEKVLKKKMKVGKNVKNADEIDKVKDWDDIRVIAYSVMKDMFKKGPDFMEIGIKSDKKLEFVKSLIGKEISAKDLLKWDLVDARGLTKGKGFQGAVKRFGVKLRHHKSEKGIRKVGSIGPWHPARVTFRVPMPGQLGMFTRVHYNLKVLEVADIKEKDINRKEGFKNYGNLKGNYLILAGSVQGPAKRQILITPPIRPNKRQTKRDYELLEVKA